MTPSLTAATIAPSDLVYQGAFRLPEGSNGSDWEYSGYGMTYYADGDPSGPADGYPGSIFAIGHDQQQYVSEISIPVPVISPSKDLNELNTASTLQGFQDIRGGMFEYLEIPRADLQVLPPQGSQTTAKLHFCWGQHFQDFEPSHGWAELDLSNPNPAGPWHFDGYTNYVTNDYLFDIPQEWAAANTPGQLLASGRFRDGLWGGRGPTLFAYGPWNDGNPPAPDSTLQNITPLLLYGIQEPGAIEITTSESMAMNGFQEPDEWSGGSWLTAGGDSAVILVGTKALGESWYGFADGTEWPLEIDDDTVYPEVPDWPYDDRGWWSEDIQAQIIFFDPADLAAVANGTLESYEPQPYASLNIDPYLFDPGYEHERKKRYLVGAASFDRSNGFLYVFERRADEDKSLVHVWKVSATGPAVSVTPSTYDFGNVDIGSGSTATTVTVSNDGSADLVLGTLSLGGPDATRFTLQNDNCSGQTLPPAGTATVQIIFSPLSAGSKTATLFIPITAPDSQTLEVVLSGTGAAIATGDLVTNDLWIRSVIETEERGPIEAVWQLGGDAGTSRGDRVIWGYFYANPDDVTWGSRDNPDLYVKIWFDAGGRLDVNFFHVSVPDIEVYSDYIYDGTVDEQGTTTLSTRYIRQFYEDGQSNAESQDEDGNPPAGFSPSSNPTGYTSINDLRIGAMINTEERGPIEAIWQPGGQGSTDRGDEVVWGYFYASPSDVDWGSRDNPDLYVKIWFDAGGRIDVNFFHVSVPDIEVYSDYPGDGTYDQAGTTIMENRYIRHEYQR
jgi:hypothetical protein